jgi:glycosyltransferase involved in cell wall biosynthesis
MEWSVVKYADRVLTTTERLRQSFIERYPVRPSDKFLCVPNSIDTTRFPLENTEAKYDALTITYAGTLYFDRTPEPLFRAVGALLREGKIGETDIRIKLVGNCRAIDGIDTMVVARRHGVESVVELLDAVPYTDAIRIMQRSHLLLMIAPEAHRLVVGAKLFDYLGSGSKILGLAEDGATADVIADTASGRCFSLSDVAGIREYILELITEKKFQTLRNDVTAFGRYDVRYLSGKLAAELSALRPERLNTAVSWSR